QSVVPRLMSVAVVVRLEVIDIYQQQREGAAVAQRLLPHAREVVIEGTAVLQTGQSVTGRHLAHQAPLEEGRAQLPFHTAIDECPDRAGDGKHADVVRDGGSSLAQVSQRRAVSDDHQSVREQGLAKQLSAQKEQRNAVRSQK